MNTLSQVTEILGWVAVINIAYLLLAATVLVFAREAVVSVHKKIFRMDEKDLDAKYFEFLGNYKIVTLVFFVAPYLALKIIGE